MRRRVHLFTFLTTLLITGACVEIVEIELDSTYTRLVVFGTITTDSIQHEIILSKTTDYFYNEPPPAVQNALVYISFNDSLIRLNEVPERPGNYRMAEPFKGVPGEIYKLEIKGVDIDDDNIEESYEASTQMPQIESADSIQLQKFITPFFSGFQLLLFSPDPVGQNWYNYKILRNNELLNRKIADYTVQPDEFSTNGYISGLPVGFLNDEDEEEALFPGDTVTLEINSISEEYYKFIVNAQNEIFGNNPLFSGPPANVNTNISNGAVGIFTAYSIDRISIVTPLPDLPLF